MSRPLLLTAFLTASLAVGCQGTKPTDPGGETTTGGPNKPRSGSAKPATTRPTLAPRTPSPAPGGKSPTPGPTTDTGPGGGTPTPGPGGPTATPTGGGTPSPTPTPVVTVAAGAGYTAALFAGGTGGAYADAAGAAAVLGRPAGPAGMVVEHGLGGVPDALYFCDPASNQIRRALLADATVSRVAGATRDAGIQKDVNAPAGIAFDVAPTSYQIYFTEPPRNGVYRQPRPAATSEAARAVAEIAGFQDAATAYREGQGVDDGTGATLAILKGPTGLALAGTTLYVADTGHHTIRTIEALRPYAVGFLAGGKGAEGAAVPDADRAGARFKGPTALAIRGTAPALELIVADTGNHCIRAIDLASPTGRVKTIAGKPGTAGHDDGAAGSATFDQPVALAVDPASGAIFVGELGTPRLRMIAADGTVSTVSGGVEPGLAVGAAAAARYTGIVGLAADVVAGKLVALYAYDRGPAFESAGQPGPRLIKLTPP